MGWSSYNPQQTIDCQQVEPFPTPAPVMMGHHMMNHGGRVHGEMDHGTMKHGSSPMAMDSKSSDHQMPMNTEKNPI